MITPQGPLIPASAKTRALVVCCTLLLGLLVFYLGNPSLPKHLGYTKLSWAELKGFTETPTTEALPTQAPYAEGVIAWEKIGATETKRRAESALFTILGPEIELEVAGSLAAGKGLQPTVALVDSQGKTLADFSLPLPETAFAPADWAAQRFRIDSQAVGREAKFIFRTPHNPAPAAWFALRERVDFFSAGGKSVSTLAFPSTGFYCLVLILVLLFVLSLSLLDLGALSARALFGLFFIAGLLVQFRTAPYFYWDEWHVLERFKNLGLPGVVYTHNEHFLPIFFAWFFSQAKLFGNHYLAFLLVSAALHALNAVLLVNLLRRLGRLFPHVKEFSVLLALIFVLSSLHAETLQWAFEQSILLSQCFTLTSMILAFDFFTMGNLWRAVLAGASGLLAPLCFGNGFSLALQLSVLLVVGNLPEHFKNRALLKTHLQRIAGLLGFLAIFTLGAVLLYKTHTESTGHGVERAHAAGHLAEVAEYLWVGTQFGSILRGLGIFPALGPESALEALASLGIRVEHPFLFLANIGFLCSLLVLVLGALWSKRTRASVQLWLTGQLLLAVCFLLPALGRWELGAGQSLSLRYHYSALLGLLIMCIPLASACYGFAASARPLLRGAVMSVFLLLIGVHFVVGRNFEYFTKQGYEHRLFVSELTSWKKQLRTLSSTQPNVDYEASGTALSGMHPANRGTITPGRHPNDIYAVLHWLNAREYPE